MYCIISRYFVHYPVQLAEPELVRYIAIYLITAHSEISTQKADCICIEPLT